MFEPRTARRIPSERPRFASAREAMAHCHVIIIGAGIGGLTAALSLQRHGFSVSVYEQASELGEVGAGLLVTPNAMHALDFLGVGGAIAATSNVSTDSRSGTIGPGKSCGAARPATPTSRNTAPAIFKFIVRISTML